MKEIRDGTKGDKHSKTSSVNSVPLILDIDDFKVNCVTILNAFVIFILGVTVMLISFGQLIVIS